MARRPPTAAAMLDFSAASRSTSLGHAHPTLVGALKAQAEKLWHVSNLFRIPEQERLAATLCRGDLRRQGLLHQFRRRGDRVRASRRRGATTSSTAIPSASASSPSPAPSTAARSRRSPPPATPKYLEGFGPPADGFDQVAVRRPQGGRGGDRPGDRGDPDRADPGRGRRPPRAGGSSCARCASSATSTACCSSSTRSRPASAAPASSSPTSGRASTPDIMAVGQGPRRRLPGRRLPRHRRGGEGHDRRHPRLDLRRQSARHGGRPGGARHASSPTASSTRSRGRASTSSSGSPSVVDSHPDLVDEVRGEGLLVGVRCKVPVAEVTAAHARPRTCSASAPATTSSACCRRSSSATPRSTRRVAPLRRGARRARRRRRRG